MRHFFEFLKFFILLATRPAKLRKLRDIMVNTVKYYREVVRPDGTRAQQEELTFVDDDDPDPNYVLTMDNAKKILAIHQRLRFVPSD